MVEKSQRSYWLAGPCLKNGFLIVTIPKRKDINLLLDEHIGNFNTKAESQAAGRNFNLREQSLADLGATIIEQVKIPSEAQKGK